jgi:hypothetical protein
MAELPIHTCPIDGCNITCRWAYLTCYPHWMMAPKALRDEAWAALEARDLGRHHKLAAQIVDAVNAKIAARAAA